MIGDRRRKVQSDLSFSSSATVLLERRNRARGSTTLLFYPKRSFPSRRKKGESPTKTRPGIQSSPETTIRNSSFSPPRSTSVVQRDVIITAAFETLGIPSFPTPNPRSFPYSVKQQCWEKEDKIRGRDPDRWRPDPLGNTVFRKLVGCPGCLCHDYDHIIPYSKGGQSTLENCQVLQVLLKIRLFYSLRPPTPVLI
ncbi:OLC1v1012444C1 [Oldenlandia corymbosa var. corymbosa]|uniref:OLC1v1012444C1 n=1 Tax=Oldenlandia corymbosa var. corymbosa TaxID=529605 RepID=A0AAV1DWM0_OLDCO|nr:OLC1v1012444C1 [Oldenlandia corymbosa var. corymbosa]